MPAAGMQRHMSIKSRSQSHRRMQWPTWTNISLSSASELVSAMTPVHTSPVNENGLDKKTLDPTYYVDIKSEGLRDILRIVLQDIRTVNSNEDKPTVKRLSGLLA